MLSQGAGFGAKIVRGAYILQERALAKARGYEDPVHENFDDTTAMYNNTMEFLLDRTKESPERIYFIVASRNVKTVAHAKEQYVLNIDCIINRQLLFPTIVKSTIRLYFAV